MKILKKGKTTWIKTCRNCGTKFEYDSLDIKETWWKEYYVKCPVCGVRIWHTD